MHSLRVHTYRKLFISLFVPFVPVYTIRSRVAAYFLLLFDFVNGFWQLSTIDPHFVRLQFCNRKWYHYLRTENNDENENAAVGCLAIAEKTSTRRNTRKTKDDSSLAATSTTKINVRTSHVCGWLGFYPIFSVSMSEFGGSRWLSCIITI